MSAHLTQVPHPILSEDQRTELATQREALRSQIRGLHTRAAEAHASERNSLLKSIRKLEKQLCNVNERLRTGHSTAVQISRSLWRRIAITADAYLYGDDAEAEAAGDLLEQLLAELDRRDPEWRSR